jgi:hypothetical protein
MDTFKPLTDVIEVNTNIAEFISHFTESILLYYNTKAFLPACILAQYFP